MKRFYLLGCTFFLTDLRLFLTSAVGLCIVHLHIEYKCDHQFNVQVLYVCVFLNFLFACTVYPYFLPHCLLWIQEFFDKCYI